MIQGRVTAVICNKHLHFQGKICRCSGITLDLILLFVTALACSACETSA